MNRRTFLKYLGIGAVGAVLGTYDYGQLSGSSANVIEIMFHLVLVLPLSPLFLIPNTCY